MTINNSETKASWPQQATSARLNQKSNQINESESNRRGDIPSSVAFLWGGFLYEGLFLPGDRNEYRQKILDCSGETCIDVVMQSFRYVQEAWLQVRKDWPLVETSDNHIFEHEVICPLGTYISEHLMNHRGKLPTLDEIKRKLDQLIYDFHNN